MVDEELQKGKKDNQIPFLLFYFGYIFVQYVQADPPTNKSLASLAVQLLQFQEDNFSKNASKPPLTRIPVINLNYFSCRVVHLFCM